MLYTGYLKSLCYCLGLDNLFHRVNVAEVATNATCVPFVSLGNVKAAYVWCH